MNSSILQYLPNALTVICCVVCSGVGRHRTVQHKQMSRAQYTLHLDADSLILNMSRSLEPFLQTNASVLLQVPHPFFFAMRPSPTCSTPLHPSLAHAADARELRDHLCHLHRTQRPSRLLLSGLLAEVPSAPHTQEAGRHHYSRFQSPPTFKSFLVKN
jgi:hypothetical protein